MSESMEKRRLWIFLLVAYGVTYVLGLLMWYGNSQGTDLTVFPSAQMMYPAAGVMLGYLAVKKKDMQMPKGFFVFYLAVALVMIVLAVLSVCLSDMLVVMPGMTVSVWNLASQYVLLAGGLVGWILLLAAGKEKRAVCGLSFRNGKVSAWMILLFVALYFLRTAISLALSGQLAYLSLIFGNASTWIMMAALFVNFFIVYLAFLGEEYGWRYYLQPLLQKKFGLRKGVILLGIVWGLWHLPVDFFYYTQDSGLVMAVAQQITCITVGIFFAYAYMKTQNIWVPVILHFLNNNLVPIISGNYSAEVLENQHIEWGELPAALLVNGLVFGIFLLAKPFRAVKEDRNKE